MAVAWHRDNSGGRTHPVGTKAANGYGVHDMSGNVLEPVWDAYGEYPADGATDPVGAIPGPLRVFRGGAWDHFGPTLRVAQRFGVDLAARSDNLGFRLSRTLP